MALTVRVFIIPKSNFHYLLLCIQTWYHVMPEAIMAVYISVPRVRAEKGEKAFSISAVWSETVRTCFTECSVFHFKKLTTQILSTVFCILSCYLFQTLNCCCNYCLFLLLVSICLVLYNLYCCLSWKILLVKDILISVGFYQDK